MEGVEYKAEEHWMMVQKARLFGDRKHAERVRASATPAEAKKIGRLVEGFNARLWEQHHLHNLAKRKGENRLGFALAEARDELEWYGPVAQ